MREGVRAFARAPAALDWRRAAGGDRPRIALTWARNHTVDAMPPLISREEALGSARSRTTPRSRRSSSGRGRRAWSASRDSTDMCSLVNAKSGGCAEDCGFCAQSRFAEAETPMHAMMEPEQILEHARAAEAAGRPPLLHGDPGPGAVQAGLRQGTWRAPGSSPSTPTSSAAPRSATCRPSAPASCARPASSASTTTSRPPSPTTTRSPPRSATRAGSAPSTAVREAGLETCVGGILNLGETREQRVEMAFELAAINPTSVPINLLNPRPGTKFGDRELHGSVGGRQVGGDLPPDPSRSAVPPLRGPGGEPRRAPAPGGQGGPQRRDDGQLPDDARQHPGEDRDDVRASSA